MSPRYLFHKMQDVSSSRIQLKYFRNLQIFVAQIQLTVVVLQQCFALNSVAATKIIN